MLGPIYSGIAQAILFLHDHVWGPVLGSNSGAAWALAIVLLVVLIRLVLFPLFVKQIHAQRQMQLLQPEIAKLRKKYAHDKQALGEATMALYREHNANPLSGCLPLIVQAPIFYGVYRVLDSATVNAKAKYGLTAAQLQSMAHSKIFGTPIAAAFTHTLHANATDVKIVTGVFIVISGAVTFFSQKLLMARRTVEVDDQQAKMQRMMLYLAPVFILGFGFRFPLGVLLYWSTSYTWTLGQTIWVIERGPGSPYAEARKKAAPRPAAAAALVADDGTAGADPDAEVEAEAEPTAATPAAKTAAERQRDRRSRAQRRGRKRR